MINYDIITNSVNVSQNVIQQIIHHANQGKSFFLTKIIGNGNVDLEFFITLNNNPEFKIRTSNSNRTLFLEFDPAWELDANEQIIIRAEQNVIPIANVQVALIGYKKEDS